MTQARRYLTGVILGCQSGAKLDQGLHLIVAGYENDSVDACVYGCRRAVAKHLTRSTPTKDCIMVARPRVCFFGVLSRPSIEPLLYPIRYRTRKSRDQPLMASQYVALCRAT